MAVFKSTDNGELIITCNCGCEEGIHLKIDKTDYDDFAIWTYMSGNFYRDQNDSAWQVIKKKCKKIWAIIANKDYYYSDVLMNADEFKQFKEYINNIEAK